MPYRHKKAILRMGFYLGWVMMARLGCLTGDGWGWSGGGDDPTAETASVTETAASRSSSADTSHRKRTAITFHVCFTLP